MSFGSVLVTGGCGCLGYHIVKQPVDEQLATSITVISRNPTQNLIEGATYLPCDITSRASLASIFAGTKPQVVFHVAATLPASSTTNTFAVMHSVNVDGTRNVLEAAQEVGTVRAFVYSSSPSIVHSGDPSMRLVAADETAPVILRPRQRVAYAHTKGVAEKMVLDANGARGVLTVSIRPSGLFGECDTQLTKPSIERAIAGRAATQIGPNTSTFDLTYAGNAAHAHLLAARALLSPPSPPRKVAGEAFNITNADPLPFWTTVRMFADAANHPVPPSKIRTIPVWLAYTMAFLLEWGYWIFTLGEKQPVLSRAAIGYTVMQRSFSIDKARRELGYEPRVGLMEGMRRGFGWYERTYGKTR